MVSFRPSRRELLAGAAALAAMSLSAAGGPGCYASSTSSIFRAPNGGSFWTAPFFPREPVVTWSGRWPGVALQGFDSTWPVNAFGDVDFHFATEPGQGLGDALPCGQIDLLSYPNMLQPLHEGKVIVVHQPNPRFGISRFPAWELRGVAGSGVAKFENTRSSDPTNPLDLFVFPDRTHVFVVGRLASDQMAAAFARNGSAPPRLGLPTGALLTEEGPLDSAVGGVLGRVMGAGLPPFERQATLYETRPGVDALLLVRLPLMDEDQAREGATEFRRQLPELQRASVEVVQSDGR